MVLSCPRLRPLRREILAPLGLENVFADGFWLAVSPEQDGTITDEQDHHLFNFYRLGILRCFFPDLVEQLSSEVGSCKKAGYGGWWSNWWSKASCRWWKKVTRARGNSRGR